MKFKSALVTAVSGSIGGATFAHNQGGMYVRARATPTNPNTSFQQIIRNLMSQITSAWQNTLTQAQRDAWEVYASNVPLTDKFGDPRYTSGIAHYVRSNVPRLQGGLARIDVGPTVYSLPTLTPPVPTVSAATDQSSTAYDNTDAWATEAGGALLIWISRPQSPSIIYFKGPYRYAGLAPGAASPPTSPQVVDTPFAVEQDQLLFHKYAAVRADGRLSAPFRVVATVGA